MCDDGCVAWQCRGFGGGGALGRCLPSSPRPFLSWALILIYLELRRWEAFAFFFFFSPSFIIKRYHSPTHTPRAARFRGGWEGGMEIGRIL